MRSCRCLVVLCAALTLAVFAGACGGKPVDVFTYVKTVQITPDSDYLDGQSCRMFYVPGRDKFCVTFGGTLTREMGDGKYHAQDRVYTYKEYSLDMEATGKTSPYGSGGAGEGRGVVAGDDFYFVQAEIEEGAAGWHLYGFNAATERVLGDRFVALDPNTESDDSFNVVWVGGQLDVISSYRGQGDGTIQHFFSPSFETVSEKVLPDHPGNLDAWSLVEVDGSYYVLADEGSGARIVEYDQAWNKVGEKAILNDLRMGGGSMLSADDRFYLAYEDDSNTIGSGIAYVYPNIRLAVFDSEWTLLQDVALTSYVQHDGKLPGSPWITLHQGKLYVSYDVVDGWSGSDLSEPTGKAQAYVAMYDLVK
jgi:hypothetical protein